MIDFYDAINEEDLETIRSILKDQPERVNEISDSGRSPLHQALCWGKHKAVSLLLSCGADVNVRDKEGYTPLHEAVNSLDIRFDSIKALIERGADVNAKAEGGYEITPLDLLATVKANDPENSTLNHIAELLIQSSANFYKVPVAAIFGSLKDVEDLVKNGADINDFLGNSHLSGLHIAAKFAKLDLAQLLIDKGANINASDINSATPLEYVSSKEIEGMLRNFGAKTSDEIWDTIYSGIEEANEVKFGVISGENLLKAAESGNLKEIEKIMAQPLEIGGLLLLRLAARNAEGKSALELAAENGHIAIVKFLLAQGMRINIDTLSDSTPQAIKDVIQNYDNSKSGG